MWVSAQPFQSQFVVEICPALADADPLGVNQNVTFDEVGGLDDRTFSIFTLSTQLILV